jgi:uncharacterized membrane protein YgdD (TMEM256/DUF423 family)
MQKPVDRRKAEHLFCCAALAGFLSVALGAFGAHYLETRLADSFFSAYSKASGYMMYHALALLGVGVLCYLCPSNRGLYRSGILFVLGMVFFSGSLLIMSLTGIRWLGTITPVGGVLLLAAWLQLAFSAYCGFQDERTHD